MGDDHQFPAPVAQIPVRPRQHPHPADVAEGHHGGVHQNVQNTLGDQQLQRGLHLPLIAGVQLTRDRHDGRGGLGIAVDHAHCEIHAHGYLIVAVHANVYPTPREYTE
nr:hypothetical protein GCM10020093_000560 [Planobispora longispora]